MRSEQVGKANFFNVVSDQMAGFSLAFTSHSNSFATNSNEDSENVANQIPHTKKTI